jgi:hypothetical protein
MKKNKKCFFTFLLFSFSYHKLVIILINVEDL